MKMMKKRLRTEAEAAMDDAVPLQDLVDESSLRGVLNLANVLQQAGGEAWEIGEEVGKKITSIDIGDNGLTQLPEEVLKVAGTAAELDISGNKFEKIPLALPGLKILRASQNVIKRVPRSINILKNLKVLELDHNKLQGFPAEVAALPNLEVLSVMSNPEVKTLPSVKFFKVFPSLTLYLDNSVKLKSAWKAIHNQLPNVNVVWNSIYPDLVRPGLFLGSLRTAQNKATYAELGVTHVLTCGRGIEVGDLPEGVKQQQIDVLDCVGEDILCHLDKAVTWITGRLKQRGVVLIHCFAGISRSATVTAAYLMATEMLSSKMALTQVKLAHPPASPNAGFVSQLSNFSPLIKRRIGSVSSSRSSSSSGSSVGHDSPRARRSAAARPGIRPAFSLRCPRPPSE